MSKSNMINRDSDVASSEASNRPLLYHQESQGSDDEVKKTVGERCKAHKWKIILVVSLIVIASSLAVVFVNHDDKPPGPTPIPPKPKPDPIPVDAGINPYFVKNGSLEISRSTCRGLLDFNQTVLNNLTMDEYIGNASAIKMHPETIPTGLNNNYTKSVSFEFGQVDFKIHKMKFSNAVT